MKLYDVDSNNPYVISCFKGHRELASQDCCFMNFKAAKKYALKQLQLEIKELQDTLRLVEDLKDNDCYEINNPWI